MTTAERQAQFEDQTEPHRKILYKICRSYARSRADAEDLAQEILVELWRSFERFDGRAQFSTWLYRVALNTAIDFARRNAARDTRLVPVADHALAAAPAPAPEGAAGNELYQLIQELDPLPRALLLLYLEGHSYQEIANVLGLSVTNVATKISRLKATMKEKVKEHKL